MRWLFWDVEPDALDLAEHARFVILRVLEKGRSSDVGWLLVQYGEDRIHELLRTTVTTELSPRTLAFWRAYFRAEQEDWPTPPAFRRSSWPPWPA